jgi:hypothetical protein
MPNMILGLTLATFTLLHTVISLVAIALGVVVLFGMLKSERMPGLTALFLITTVLTSVTGFLFPSGAVTPAQIVGAISLVALAFALLALYAFDLNGAWRWVYVSTAVLALYLNVFVLVVQAFQKVPGLNALAPNGSEPPFVVAQSIMLLLFAWLGYQAVRNFRPDALTSG